MTTAPRRPANPVAVVTGGTRGIGRAVTLAAARSGATVFALHARNRQAADALEAQAVGEGLDVRCLRGDLSREEAVAAAGAAVAAAADENGGRVHWLVHCAATGVHRPVAELTLKHLRFTLETNVLAFHALLVALLPRLADGARVVALTSGGATRTAPQYAAVGASKGALDALMRHWAVELAPRGVAANLVSPGLVETGALDAFPDRDERLRRARASTPTGRLATAEEVAETVLWLLRDAPASLTGHTVVLDGGRGLAG
ncbi:MAG TPA: SDR family oxidoreductase [Thermoanaerobaculia bacterium]|nr:SDR family oxidoreductase [Thermoanaerobaculia bacterium]